MTWFNIKTSYFLVIDIDMCLKNENHLLGGVLSFKPFSQNFAELSYSHNNLKCHL